MGRRWPAEGGGPHGSARRRGRRAAAWGAALGLLAIALALFAARQTFLERWKLHVLATGDAEAARAAAVWLGDHGSASAVDPLVDAVDAEGPAAGAALEALGSLLPRLGGPAVERAVEALLGFATGEIEDSRDETPAGETLAEVLPGASAAWMPAARQLGEGDGAVGEIVVPALLEAWPRSRVAVVRALDEKPVLFLDAVLAPGVRAARLAPRHPGDAAIVPERLAWLARKHPDPEVRAVALTAVAAIDGTSDLIVERARDDPHAVVQRAVLRVAAVLGRGPRRDALLVNRLAELAADREAPEEALLAAAIEARYVAAEAPSLISSFVLLPYVTSRLPAAVVEIPHAVRDTLPRPMTPGAFPGALRAEHLPWRPGEKELLRGFLAECAVPEIRDAASRALAVLQLDGARAAASGASPPRAGASGEDRVEPATANGSAASGLRVHELAFFFDGPPAPEALEALRPDDAGGRAGFPSLGGNRAARALHVAGRWSFRARHPQVLYVGAGLPRGAFGTASPPDTGRYPRDLLLWSRSRNLSRFSPQPPVPGTMWLASEQESFAGWDRHAVVHPSRGPASVDSAVAALLRPVRRRREGQSQAGPWIEWCGLRAGYPGSLEGGAAASGDRDAAGVARVARAGRTGDGLRLAGLVRMSAPVTAWRDANSPRALILEARGLARWPWLRRPQPPLDPALPRWWGHRGRRGAVPAVLVVERRGDAPPRGALVRGLDPLGPRERVELDALPLEGAGVLDALATVLRERGMRDAALRRLREKHAGHLVEVEGLRIITVVPRWWHDIALPLAVHPLPEHVVRAGLLVTGGETLRTRRVRRDRAGPRLSRPERLRDELQLTRELELRETAAERRSAVPVDGPDLAADLATLGSFALSPGGRYVALVGGTGSGARAVLVDLEERTARTVLAPDLGGRLDHGGIAVTGGGRRVAVVEERPQGGQLRVVDLDRGVVVETPVLAGARLGPGGFSADGTVAVLAAGEVSKGSAWLHRVDLDAGTSTVLVPPGPGPVRPGPCGAAVSPDGRWIAVSIGERDAFDLRVLDLEDRTLRRVAPARGFDGHARLGGDGLLVWESEARGDADIRLADLDTGEVRELSAQDGPDRQPSISANGRWVVWARDEGIVRYDHERGTSTLVEGTRGGRSPRVGPAGGGVFIRAREDGTGARLERLPEP